MLKYPSLVNHYNVLKSRKLAAVFDKKSYFYATEKIHGSNMSIEFTENSTRYFSRNREVTLDDKALGSYLASTSNLPYIENAARLILNREEVNKIIVFGELYGANIQNMQYRENIDGVRQFKVFDVFVFEDNIAYSMSLAELIFHFSGLTVPIMPGAMSLREYINTELPTESCFGGPIEGLVYKPHDRQILEFDNGVVCNYLGVKHKTEQFAEIKNVKKIKPELTADEYDFKINIENYFTMQRLDNLLSKGDIELSVKNLGSIIPAYLDDVKTDYIKDNPNAYFNQRILSKSMPSTVVKLVKEKLAKEEFIKERLT